eukprot:gene24693-31067_t
MSSGHSAEEIRGEILRWQKFTAGMIVLSTVVGIYNYVNHDHAHGSGFTALFYAVQKASPSILGALLRRGADPNVIILQEGSREYGALPNAVNQHGQTPLQLLPADAVRSTKLYFKKSFEDAYTKLRTAAAAEITIPTASFTNNEL